MTFNLDKVKFVLDKREINDIPCNVVFGVDVSGSMVPLYKRNKSSDSVIQLVTNRIFSICLSVDVDKEMQMFAFDSYSHKLPVVNEKNIGNYVNKYITNCPDFWSGTNYAPVIKDICAFVNKTTKQKSGLLSKLFKQTEPKPSVPVLGLIITDGECFDAHRAEEAILKSQDTNIYWNFIGIGDPSQFKVIQKLADDYPNVGFIPMPRELDSVDDEDLYDAIINDEFAEWIKQFKNK